ncbi:MAG TPA: methionine adenosyltransferase [Candidatus Lokiarchaeia archaeon]|nr:methionine adenosyltransferase [Candidatus Lokiarchaeia archaeon]
MTIHVNKSLLPQIEETLYPEMVERKGKGHPDSVCDEAAEACSRALCKYYMENYGRFFHHNVDKAALVGGAAAPVLGGGKIIDPQYFMIVGRAITQLLDEKNMKVEKIPVGPICLKAMRDTIKKSFRWGDKIDDYIQFDYRIRSGSVDLTGVFDENAKDQLSAIPLANDTSFGTGFAPFSDCEKITYEAEMLLNSDDFKAKVPACGEDIKVMSRRLGKSVYSTICSAMVAEFCPDLDAYMNAKEEINVAVRDLAAKIIPDKEFDCATNVGDLINKENPIVYITITGTSAESGDDGEVGRGNRANGLITPCRTMTLEACAGKNPVNHVGKLYSIFSNRISEKIVEEGRGDVIECQMRILSQIGHPINDPWICDIIIVPAENANFENMQNAAADTAQAMLDDYVSLRDSIIAGNERVW